MCITGLAGPAETHDYCCGGSGASAWPPDGMQGAVDVCGVQLSAQAVPAAGAVHGQPAVLERLCDLQLG